MKKILAIVFVLLANAALAQPALVKDINTTWTGSAWQWPFNTEFVEMGGVVYFTSSDGIHGTEIWRTDGTAAGTSMVKDICPGACASWTIRLAVWGSHLYFSADDGAHGKELWKSDGTAAGTVLVKDLSPGRADSTPSDFFELGGTLYFSAYQETTGRELWKTDGTAAGTALVVDLWPGANTSFPRPMGRIGSTVLLNAMDATHGLELWSFDGSPGGPVLVKDINPGANGSIYEPWFDLQGHRFYIVSGNRLYFAADGGNAGYELWASDGTEAGTVQVKSIQPGSESSWPSSFVELNGELLFRANDTDHGFELWKTDGTEANTVLVKDIRSGADSSTPWELTVLGSWAYFRAQDDTHGAELWRSDGTEANTTLVKDIRPGTENGIANFGPVGFAVVGTSLTFFADDGTNGAEPWKSDGTEAGTALLADLNPGAGSSMFFLYGPIADSRAVSGGRWYFRAFDSEWDAEVYTSDATTAGTQQLVEINEQASAFEVSALGSFFETKPMADRNGTLFFQAFDGISGQELWKSDGTEAGTEQVADIEPGATGSAPAEITPLGGNVIFTTGFDSSAELWISDGTEAGTSLLHDVDSPQGLTAFGGNVYFAGGPPNDWELWKSDGTEAGTVPVRETAPIPLSPSLLTPAGSLLYFSGGDPVAPVLWRTDGTAAGTFPIPVAGINPPPPPTYPDNLTWRVGNVLYFSAESSSHGRELWASNGLNQFLIKDTRPGTASGLAMAFGFRPEVWAATSRKLLFVADDGTAGQELWVAGNVGENGTVLLKDIFPGSRSSEILWLTTVGEQVFFVADDGVHGRELWVTDGTGSGTRMVIDLVPGEGSSLPEHFQAVGQNLVFSAHTPDHGRELWLSDGWAVGTRRVSDIAPDPIPSSPLSFTLSGPWLYFVANDSETGFELYSVPREEVDGGMDFYTVSPCRIVDTRSSAPVDGMVTFEAAGLCGIPETAQALSVNVTAVDPSISGELALFRAGTNLPGTSSLSFIPGKIRANNAMVHLGDGAFSVAVFPEFNMSVHVVVDVNGYFE